MNTGIVLVLREPGPTNDPRTFTASPEPKDSTSLMNDKSTDYLDRDPLMNNALVLGALTLPEGQAALVGYMLSRTTKRSTSARRIGFVEQVRLFFRHYQTYRELRRKLGAELQIPYHEVDDLLEEVARHRWIEAEKAGADIWVQRDPKDPMAPALRDWFTKHYNNWHKAREERAASLGMIEA